MVISQNQSSSQNDHVSFSFLKNYKIALLFGYFQESIYNNVVENSIGGIQNAADALQKSLVEGIVYLHKETEIINLPYIGSFPKRYRKLFSPTGDFEYTAVNGNLVKGKNIRFCNLSVYKIFDRYIQAKNAINKWCKKYENKQKVLLVYAMHAPFVKACVDVKKEWGTSLKIVLIIPDLPQFMSSKSSLLYSCAKTITNKLFNREIPKIDAFVLLSKYMRDLLPISDKPWIVVEGIYDKSNDVENTIYEDVKTIFYAGTLAKRYGIMNLVKAFVSLQNDDIRLVICGAGDAEKEIKLEALRDERIIFKGQLPRKEVLRLQRKATLLVNPRTPEGEFTKYSFPSKTMEYLASGVPTLLYKLPGIPDEYYEYCYTLEQLGVESLSQKLSIILSSSQQHLRSVGRKARNFILSQKNPIKQCEKIMMLIERL